VLFITQPDHAILAADVARHFDRLDEHPRRDMILLAAREHDNGWHEPDEALVFDDESGRALDFIGVTDALKQSVWPVAIDRVAVRSLYAAALIAEHAAFVYGANRDKPAWRGFFEDMERRRDDLLRRAEVPRDTLADDYRFVALADLISLSFCNGWTEPRERFGHRVWSESDAVVVSPAIVPRAPIAIRVRARRIADRRYGSAAELRRTLDAAPVEWIDGHARGRDPE
jgi:hypothetical protein